MNKHAKLILILIVPMFVGGCAVPKLPTMVNQSSSMFMFDQTEFDFGTVKQSAVKVSHPFVFTYTGDQPIKVVDLPASCGCTTATIDNPNLTKGSKGVITITFNPNHHAEPAGKFFRTVSIVTDPKVATPELKIWAQVDMDIGPQVFEMKTPDND